MILRSMIDNRLFACRRSRSIIMDMSEFEAVLIINIITMATMAIIAMIIRDEGFRPGPILGPPRNRRPRRPTTTTITIPTTRPLIPIATIVPGPDPAGVPKQRLDAREGDDDRSDKTLPIRPIQRDTQRRQALQRVIRAQHGADHDKDARRKHDCQNHLAMQRHLQLD